MRSFLALYATFFVIAAFFHFPVLKGDVLAPVSYLKFFEPWKSTTFAKEPEPQWTPLLADGLLQFVPWRMHLARSLASGEIPLWNPYQGFGAPFLANGQSAVFYPPNWLLAILPMPWGMGLLAIAHCGLAGCFLAWWVRRLGGGVGSMLVAGAAFQLCAFMTYWTELPSMTNSLIWLPAALAAFELPRTLRSLCLAGLFLGLMFLGGHPQIAYYGALTFSLYAVIRGKATRAKAIAMAALPLGLAVLVAAVQLVPLYEFSTLSHRSGEARTLAGYEGAAKNSLAATQFGLFLIPDLFGSPHTGDYFAHFNFLEAGAAIGSATVFFLISACWGWRRNRAIPLLFGIALFWALVAFGTPLAQGFYFAVPGFAKFGNFARALGIYAVFACAAAGLGVDDAFEHKPRRWIIGLGVMFALAAVALLLAYQGIEPQNRAEADVFFSFVLPKLGRFVAIGAGAALLIWLWTRNNISEQLAKAACVLLIVGEMFGTLAMFNPAGPAEKLTALPSALSKYAGSGERIAGNVTKWRLEEAPEAWLPPNLATFYQILDENNYDSLLYKPYVERMQRIQAGPVNPQANGNICARHSAGEGLLVWPKAAVERWLGPNRIRFEGTDLSDRITIYPGWRKSIDNEYVFEPFSYLIGRWLSLTGIVATALLAVSGGKSRRNP